LVIAAIPGLSIEETAGRIAQIRRTGAMGVQGADNAAPPPI
jgi:hypothetical protein